MTKDQNGKQQQQKKKQKAQPSITNEIYWVFKKFVKFWCQSV